MGGQLAREALRRGHRVHVVSGPGTEPFPPKAKVVWVEAAADMERQLRRQAPRADAVIMAAAVADFRPLRARRTKLPRRAGLTLRLTATPDLIARLPRKPGQVVVGFALETGRVLLRARRKLRQKRLDVLLAQQAAPGGASPFGRHPVRAWLLAKDGAVERLGRLAKPSVARALLDKVEALWYGQQSHSTRP